MDDDLRNYKLQLQQVDAALISDANNDELLKLKSDLEEVIALTLDLIKTQQEESIKFSEDSRGSGGHSNDDDDVTASLLALERGIGGTSNKKRKWKLGDKCQAKWKVDGQFYEALIGEVTETTVKVTFLEYNQTETCGIEEIKELSLGVKRPAEDSGDEASKLGKPHTRDYLKKKKQKKQQRFKKIEEDRESEKNKWLSFAAKSSKKQGSGSKGKSIFASPDNVNGRVGIGTCGISGKPMTEYTHGEKWRKGA